MPRRRRSFTSYLDEALLCPHRARRDAKRRSPLPSAPPHSRLFVTNSPQPLQRHNKHDFRYKFRSLCILRQPQNLRGTRLLADASAETSASPHTMVSWVSRNHPSIERHSNPYLEVFDADIAASLFMATLNPAPRARIALQLARIHFHIQLALNSLLQHGPYP